MSNFRKMASQWLQNGLFEKISNLKNMNILYIILKHVVWRFRIYNYFREISKFRDFMNTLRNFAKSVFAHIFAKFKYFAKVYIRNLQTKCFKMVYNMFIFLKFEIFSNSRPGTIAEPFRENCS